MKENNAYVIEPIDGLFTSAASVTGLYAVPTTSHPEGTVILPKGKTIKYDGNGVEMIVDDPDYVTEDGMFRKHRKKVTDKKPRVKRKKNKKTHR